MDHACGGVSAQAGCGAAGRGRGAPGDGDAGHEKACRGHGRARLDATNTIGGSPPRVDDGEFRKAAALGIQRVGDLGLGFHGWASRDACARVAALFKRRGELGDVCGRRIRAAARRLLPSDSDGAWG